MPPRLLAERVLAPLLPAPPKAFDEERDEPPKSRELAELRELEPPMSRVLAELREPVLSRVLAELREPVLSRVPTWLPDRSR
jgi:hypothetical protein